MFLSVDLEKYPSNIEFQGITYKACETRQVTLYTYFIYPVTPLTPLLVPSKLTALTQSDKSQQPETPSGDLWCQIVNPIATAADVLIEAQTVTAAVVLAQGEDRDTGAGGGGEVNARRRSLQCSQWCTPCKKALRQTNC